MRYIRRYFNDIKTNTNLLLNMIVGIITFNYEKYDDSKGWLLNHLHCDFERTWNDTEKCWMYTCINVDKEYRE